MPFIMSAKLGSCSTSARAELGMPTVSKPQCHFRRSTLTKHPRKRTFVMVEMTKYTAASLGGSGALAGQSSAAAFSSVAPITLCRSLAMTATPACGGNDGGNGPRSPISFSRGPEGEGFNSGSQGGISPRTLLLAAALSVGLCFLNTLPTNAASINPATQQQQKGRQCPSTLCLNTRRTRSARRGVASKDDLIVYGHVDLTPTEHRMLACPQLRFREAVRV